MLLYSEIPQGAVFPPTLKFKESGFRKAVLSLPVLTGHVDADPDGGCGCGENCDRGAGDACPLDVLYAEAGRRRLTRARINAQIIVPGSTVCEQIRNIWADRGYEAAWNFICLFGEPIP